MLHELIQFVNQDPFVAIVIFGIAATAIVGAFKYLAYIIRGDPTILADDDE